MSSAMPNSDVLQRVQALRNELHGLTAIGDQEDLPISSGCDAFDRLLPGNGFSWGSLVEWLVPGRASGAGSLAIHVARQAMRQQRGCLVVTDRWQRFYPPAAVGLGIDPPKLIVTRPRSAAEELWALDQALRCPGVSAVLAWIDHLDALAFRRLQLAAETGQTLGLLIRPATVQHQPTWSEVQLLVQPVADQGDGLPGSLPFSRRALQVTLLRQRGRVGACEGSSLELEIDEQQHTLQEVTRRRHETRHLHMAPRVAPSTNHRRSAGA
jgi:hypothetical protein